MHELQHLVKIPDGTADVEGDLVIPPEAGAVVLFAHGNAGSRHSPRNLYVAGVLQQAGIATLMIDLLTPDEEEADLRAASFRLNVALFNDRVCAAIDWLQHEQNTYGLEIGLFGAGIGGGAVLEAAAQRPEIIKAVVSRGGRPDLAGDYLQIVTAPALLIVGENDSTTAEVNKQAFAQLKCKCDLQLVAGASHLFEEEGAMDQVALLSCDWFLRNFKSTSATVV